MTEMELTNFFSKFGEVKDAKIITDRDGGKSRGYGFVTFATEEQAAYVYSKGSIYYEQKKLNVAKAIRKHGGQYQKANQEFVNGQHRLVWLHPNGYLMTQQEGGWMVDQVSSQQVKPCYPLLPQPSSQGLYAPMNSAPYMQTSQFSQPPTYGYGYGMQYATPPPYPYDALSIISTPDSISSPTDSAFDLAPPPAPVHKYTIDMKALEVKTKQLSLDSAYTSEADLDSSHNTTATNSGAVSPKEFSSKPSSSTPSPRLATKLSHTHKENVPELPATSETAETLAADVVADS